MVLFLDCCDFIDFIHAHFMGNTLAAQLRIEREPLPKPIQASALDSCLLCSVTHCTVPIHLGMAGNHQETISFDLINAPSLPFFNMGYAWLKLHNPHINRASSLLCHRHPAWHISTQGPYHLPVRSRSQGHRDIGGVAALAGKGRPTTKTYNISVKPKD